MRILTANCFLPYWGRDLPANILDLDTGPTVGGGEEAHMRTAVGLTKLGHEVHAFWYGKSGTWEGTPFYGYSDPLYPRIINEDWDAIVAFSGVYPLEVARPGVRRIFAQQLNDLAALEYHPEVVDCIVSPSQSHAEMVRDAWRWGGKRAVVHNGLLPELYEGAPAWSSRPKWVGYWSSPDRGLHHLLRAWPEIRRREPEAQLHVFYEINRYLSALDGICMNCYGERGQSLARLVFAMKDDPSVFWHGAVTRRELAKFQVKTRVHCYPYDPFQYCEGFAGAVNQGLASGCTVMTTRKDALPSLYGDSIHWLPDIGVADYAPFLADQVVRGLNMELPRQAETMARGPVVAARYTWDAAALEMERACKGEGWF